MRLKAVTLRDVSAHSSFFLLFPDFARAVAARPISYAAVLRMKPDSSSVLSSRGRPRQHHGGGLGVPDWPAFSSHPLSALSLLGSQEDYRSEGKTNGAVKPTVCLLRVWTQNGWVCFPCVCFWCIQISHSYLLSRPWRFEVESFLCEKPFLETNKEGWILNLSIRLCFDISRGVCFLSAHTS